MKISTNSRRRHRLGPPARGHRIRRQPAIEEPFDLSGPSFGPVNGEEPAKLVILLHGVGADGDDLIGLAPRFARVLPDAEFLSPHAPYAYDMAPVGRQWFSLADRSPSRTLAGIRATAPIVSGFIDRELERRGLAERDLALIGFSQGAMLALHVALRRAEACAALIGYSGALAGRQSLAAEIRASPPVLLVHGAADEVVPAGLQRRAVAALEAAGVRVSAHIRPGLGHGIDEEGIRLGTEFLAAAFAKRQAGTG